MRKLGNIYKIILFTLALSFTLIAKANIEIEDNEFCNVKCGIQKTFTVKNIAGANYTWQLFNDKGKLVNATLKGDFNECKVNIPVVEGYYTLSVNAKKDGCESEVKQRLMVSKVDLSIVLEGADYLCGTQERKLTAKVVSADVNEDEIHYKWFLDDTEIITPNDNVNFILVKDAGTYSVEVSTDKSIMKHVVKKTFDLPKELPDLEVMDEVLKFANDLDLTIENLADLENDKGYKYEWSVLQDGTKKRVLLTEEKNSKLFVNKINKAGVYTVKVSNAFCTVSKDIKTMRWNNIGVPTGFSPEVGNTLVVVGDSDDIVQLSFTIFNRYGLQMFETTDINFACTEGWDGRCNGELQPIDGYVYFLNITFADGIQVRKKGVVSLLR
ncbi:MAG: hypothetical protein WBG43_11380 [Marinifilaceae bacterium]